MKTLVSILRMAIGWHFLYEGIVKLTATHWTSESFLNNTHGFLSGFYHWLAAVPVRLEIVDYLNIFGLLLIGFALIIGIFGKWASVCGAFLLTLYYFAYPPFGISLLSASNGSVYIVNPLFVEAAVLVFLFCLKEKGYGLEHLIHYLKEKKRAPAGQTASGTNTRREMLKNLAGLPIFGLIGWGAFRSHRRYGADVLSGATIQVNQAGINELKGTLPKGKIGNLEISRLILGSNLISGYSHARDLIYTNELFKAYNTERKVFETLALAEQAGINTINAGMNSVPAVAKYKKLTNSKLQVIAQANIPDKDIFSVVDKCIDEYGVDVVQIHGGSCDGLAEEGRSDSIGMVVEHIKSRGYIVGLGAHSIDSLLICEANGIIPDYYMKTLHHDNYWSAHPRENRRPFEVTGPAHPEHDLFHENCFCSFPERTVEFISRMKTPVVGFKVLAAGAIQPADGFHWAFANGADFICVGMFDFQIVRDVNICMDVLRNLTDRKREWYG
ncbi:MAG: DoxX family protein [Tannerella sp.]|nr:DoxX family protein [Tannerella sp.]